MMTRRGDISVQKETISTGKFQVSSEENKKGLQGRKGGTGQRPPVDHLSRYSQAKWSLKISRCPDSWY